MGAVDVIPGVSGGTIAFISGIYDELLHSIKAVDVEAIQLLLKFRFADFWKKINGNFLIVVFAGIGTSILSLAKVVIFLLKHYPILIWSFFFGVIIISAPLVLREIKKWNLSTGLSFIMGLAIAYSITILEPTQTPNHLWFIFICGVLAFSVMILPGLSGGFILLLIGKYQYIITALIEPNGTVVLIFISGGALGIIGFSRIMTWILDTYHHITVALLSGFMLGSINKVWPWREVLEYATDSKGEQVAVFDKSILPWNYLSVTGKDPQLFQAIFMIALGVFMVVLIEKIAARLKTKH
jgi:putative membrane protein